MRSDDISDRRRVLVRLTELGEVQVTNLSTIHLAEIDRIGAELKHLLSQMRKAPQTSGT